MKTSLISHHLSSQDSLSQCLHIFTEKQDEKQIKKMFLLQMAVSVITDGILISQQPPDHVKLALTVSPWHSCYVGLM